MLPPVAGEFDDIRGRLEVIANYTAFQDIRAELDRVN
jgi:hypothetical protein